MLQILIVATILTQKGQVITPASKSNSHGAKIIKYFVHSHAQHEDCNVACKPQE